MRMLTWIKFKLECSLTWGSGGKPPFLTCEDADLMRFKKVLDMDEDGIMRSSL